MAIIGSKTTRIKSISVVVGRALRKLSDFIATAGTRVIFTSFTIFTEARVSLPTKYARVMSPVVFYPTQEINK